MSLFSPFRPYVPGKSGKAAGTEPAPDPHETHAETKTTLATISHEDDRHTITHFSRLLARHGQSHASLEWNSRESQERRFEALSQVGIAAGDSLLDVGCGIGDLVAWLDRAALSVDYTGLDLTPMMVETARDRFPDRTFVQGCLLAGPHPPPRRYDWAVASGLFAHRRESPDAYMRAMIRALLARADKGVAVNSLSLKAPQHRRWTLFHADPDATLEWAQTQVPVAVLREDYDPNDFTLYLYTSKDAAKAMRWRP